MISHAEVLGLATLPLLPSARSDAELALLLRRRPLGLVVHVALALLACLCTEQFQLRSAQMLSA